MNRLARILVVAGPLFLIGRQLRLDPLKSALGIAAVILAFDEGTGYLGRRMSFDGWRRQLVAGTGAMSAISAFLIWWFHRDPERYVPTLDGIIVSPADGEILYIYESVRGQLPHVSKSGKVYPLVELTRTDLGDGDVYVIGITLRVTDVHVNRVPISGRVEFQERFKGRHGSLRNVDKIFENTRVTTIFRNGEMRVAVVQIAERVVRKIVSYVHEGQTVALGQRFGMIRFGSQVDVVIPVRWTRKITVHVGDRVRAGESILAMRRGEEAPA